MKNILILVGSSGKNAELAQSIQDIGLSAGYKLTIKNLIELNLPLYSSVEEAKGIPSSAKELTDEIISAEALIVISPEYNGSMAPSINNAIAWVSRAHEDWRKAFNGKSTLIATHSGGGGSHVLMALRHQLSYVGANVLGRQILTNFSKELNSESLKACLAQL